MEKYDLIIVGGGMVGAAAACGLAQHGFRIALIEAQEPQAYEHEQPMDLRVSAISAASERLLRDLGAWQHVEAMRAAPYDTLATWEWQRAEVSFEAAQIDHSHLGHIVENRVVQLALWQALAQYDNVDLRVGQRPERLWQDEAGAYLQLGEATLAAELMLGCDGARSGVRQAAGIGLTGWRYRHSCLAINVSTALPQQRITWQAFTADGPRAFLPLTGARGSLVWYDSPERIEQLMRLDKAALKRQVQTHFPQRLGDFEIEAKAAFPLTRQHAQHYYQGRMVLLGDAAHTINPLAGQGVNLGFKDVAALEHILGQARQKGESVSAPEVLSRYQCQRRADNLAMQTAMDVFYHAFSNDWLPLKLGRNLALTLAQRSGPVKQQVMRYAMGL
ncbi:FAD-dependent oxidoreductase [Ferrimonas pelagia]|uniref:FAD-dependent monooxygenase n=1 Tax=Ferrimonas pelagia TaxID=1177826 RepID=A0ABP9EIH4_9GAMM